MSTCQIWSCIADKTARFIASLLLQVRNYQLVQALKNKTKIRMLVGFQQWQFYKFYQSGEQKSNHATIPSSSVNHILNCRFSIFLSTQNDLSENEDDLWNFIYQQNPSNNKARSFCTFRYNAACFLGTPRRSSQSMENTRVQYLLTGNISSQAFLE